MNACDCDCFQTPKVLCRDSLRRELYHHEEQVGFRPDCGCTDQIPAVHCLNNVTFTKAQPSSCSWKSGTSLIPSTSTLRNRKPKKYASTAKVVYQTSGKVRVYGQLSPSFNASTGVPQRCPSSYIIMQWTVCPARLSTVLQTAACNLQRVAQFLI